MNGVLGPPVIVQALRSPIGSAGGSLAHVTAADLAATVARTVLADVEAPVTHVVLGNCMGPGGNVARVAALEAGLPAGVPAVTVDLQCGSGLEAVSMAADKVRLARGMVLAGGTESTSTAPWRFWPPTVGEEPVRYERAPFAPRWRGDPDMGLAADLLAEERGITRRRQDAYAARSHALAHAASVAGDFDAEIVPVADLKRDQRPRPGLDESRLARLRPAFRPGGSVTAGNSCGLNDGAAVVAVVDSDTYAGLGLPGLRVLATATVGVDPRKPGVGPVPAVQKVLVESGLTLDDFDVIEVNEAFGAQVLACCDDLRLDPERVCRQGGAIALGHPWGASGAVLVVRMFSQLVRERRGRFGLAAIAVGGGQGVAMVVEACR